MGVPSLEENRLDDQREAEAERPPIGGNGVAGCTSTLTRSRWSTPTPTRSERCAYRCWSMPRRGAASGPARWSWCRATPTRGTDAQQLHRWPRPRWPTCVWSKRLRHPSKIIDDAFVALIGQPALPRQAETFAGAGAWPIQTDFRRAGSIKARSSSRSAVARVEKLSGSAASCRTVLAGKRRSSSGTLTRAPAREGRLILRPSRRDDGRRRERNTPGRQLEPHRAPD